ncbi:MAG TPA: TetR family transcriptional regulator [Bryobacteraceae bacterium]|nr:TetR family transcriptional regulator [Bryobacteraceae bacterium]
MNNSGARQAPVPLALNKHQQRTEATRRALIDSARRIFARDGFEACRIEDIAAATGHTRGAFYAHFQTKEDLFFALLEQEANGRADQIRAALACCETVDDQLAAVRSFYVKRFADRRWAVLMLEFKLFALRHPKLRPRLAATHRRIRASLKLDIQQMCEEHRKAALESILAALTLEQAYDPRRLSKEQAAHLLGLLFDVLVLPIAGDTTRAAARPSGRLA